MREIKFALYCEIEGKWRGFGVTGIEYERYGDSEIRKIHIGDLVVRGEALRNGEAHLVQYTSLKDKDGREIYDGDILQTDYYPCSVGDDYVLVVEYDIDRFWCVRKLKANANARGISDGIADGLYEFLDHGLKVIGNIYENKELLEEK